MGGITGQRVARLGPVILEGRTVRLEPLRHRHLDDLLLAGADPAIWRWLAVDGSTRPALERWLDEALAAEARGAEYPFAVISLAERRAVGSTRYLDVQPEHRGVEVGWTWYAPRLWGTTVNPECKLLLLKHAFEDWGAIRVCLKTDSLNARSRAAILKLGAKYEGDLRNHRVRPDGSYRDSSYYSIVADEWSVVKRALDARLI